MARASNNSISCIVGYFLRVGLVSCSEMSTSVPAIIILKNGMYEMSTAVTVLSSIISLSQNLWPTVTVSQSDIEIKPDLGTIREYAYSSMSL